MYVLTLFASFLVLGLVWLTPPCATSVQHAYAHVYRCSPANMELERLVQLGKEMDLSGEALREFVEGEQDRIASERREKQNKEREIRE